MTRIFFDRNIAKTIPSCLLKLGINKHDVIVTYHCQPKSEVITGGSHKEPLFHPETPDEEIFQYCGDNDLVLISQDYKWQYEKVHQLLIEQHKVRVFLLWGAEAKRWDTIRAFGKSFETLVAIAKTTVGPFVKIIGKDGRITDAKLRDGYPKGARAIDGRSAKADAVETARTAAK